MSKAKSIRTAIWVFLSFTITPATFAGDAHPYVSLGIHDSNLHLSDSHPQINYFGGLLNYDYPPNSRREHGSLFAAQGGYEFFANKASLAFGLGAYSTLSKYGYSGRVMQTSLGDPTSLLYNYEYNIASTRLMAEAKFSWHVQRISPFVNVGLGEAWTRINAYSESTVDDIGYVALPAHQSRTNTRLAYQAGFGLAYAFNCAGKSSSFLQDRFSIGYEYVGLGRGEMGTRGSEYPYKLKLGRLNSNDLYISFTHLF
jgi:hypothetical protein